MSKRAAAACFGAALALACGASKRTNGPFEAAGGNARAGAGGMAGGGTSSGGGTGGATGGTDVGTAGDPGLIVSRTIASYEKDVSRALCELEVRCGSMSSVERCMEFRNGMRATVALRAYEEVAYDRYFAGADLIAYLEHEYRLADDATLDACSNAIAAAACDRATFSPKECQHVLVPKAPRALGAACDPPNPFFQERPCGEGLECTCGVCAPARQRLGEGSACEEWDDCESGLQCRSLESTTKTCGDAPRVGERCDGAWHCADGDCVNEVCVPFAAVGEHCGDEASCPFDLTCNDGVCIASAGVTGDTCGRGGGQCLLWCVFDAPASSQGTCGVPSTSSPTPCSSYADDRGQWCPSGAYNDERDEGGTSTCNCLPKVPLGGACNDDYDAGTPTYRPCATGICRNGVCQAQLANGVTCSNGGECASFTCDATSGTCVPQECTP